MNAMSETAGKEAGWVPCRRCKGTGEYQWEAGKSGPCFLCNGTGDGRIRNFSGLGPRRSGGRRRSAGEAAPAVALAGEAPQQAQFGAAQTAAEHMAAALAALTQQAPMDEEAVRDLVAEAFGERDAQLEALAQAVEEQLRSIPRRLEIVIGEHRGELPALRHPGVEDLLVIVAQRIPAYVVGPAGSGKTTAAEQVAHALGLRFYLQGALSGSHEVLGFVDAHGRYQTTPWRQAYEHGGVMLLDEIDASDAAALLAANAGIANGHMAFPDRAEPVKRHADFRLVAAANTFGTGANRQYVGRTQLDAATLNRFAFLAWDYDERLERTLAANDDWCGFVQSVRRAVDHLKIRHVVSPRQSVMGAQLLAAGMERSRVEAIVLWQGMSAEDQHRVRGHI